jgi:hypothetical protein
MVSQQAAVPQQLEQHELTKLRLLHIAEVIDSLRIFPRIIMGVYLSYAGWLTSYLVIWYSHLPAAGRGTQESAMVGGVIAAVTGFFPSVLKIYQDGGRDWGATPTLTSTMDSTTVTTTRGAT